MCITSCDVWKDGWVSSPAHLCAVAYITEISVHVTLDDQSHSLSLIHFQFHTFTGTRVYRWHLNIQGMRKWPNLSNNTKFHKLFCDHDGPVY